MYLGGQSPLPTVVTGTASLISEPNGISQTLVNKSAPLRPELAWTCCDYAGMFQERNNGGYRSEAMAVMKE